MTTTPQAIRYATTEHLSRTHNDEFVAILDSLGRLWNPLKHPRDENGRFIRTFSFVNFNVPGSTAPGSSVSGRVTGIDKNGDLLVKVEGVQPGAPPEIKPGDYVKVPHDQVEVRTVKAKLGGRGSAGKLNGQESRSMQRGVDNLRRLKLDEQADKLQQALDLANAPVDRRNPAASQASKDQAIATMREVAESLDEERGKGFDEGTDYNEVKANLTSEERARLQTIDQVMGTTFTARHSLGDKTIDAENDEGPIKAKAGEVRLQAAEKELKQDYSNDVSVWDTTSGELTEGHLEQPTKAIVRDDVREQQGTEVLPELQRSTYQKLRTGLSRLSGWKQAQQVAPGDRFHVDKEDNEVVVGSIVHADPTKSRGAFTGMVTRIYTDAQNKKHVYVRDFDPAGDKGYPKRYKDHSVQGGSIMLADDAEQSEMFQQLALMGASEASKSLVQSFTNDYLDTMQRRYASPDAKRVSPTGGFFDVAPVQDRVRQDRNGEGVRIGDSVMGPNGEVGVVTYIDPNENTVKVQYPNGQKAARISSRKTTRLHGPTSDVYLRESAYGDNNYVPTREEAAALADEMGATSVAETIRDGGSARDIQAAMSTDVEFQSGLDDVAALYDRRDQALSAGQEPTEEDKKSLHDWDRLAAASAEQFREEDTPPEIPEAPTPDADGEAPQNPANPSEKVSEGGVTVADDGEGTVVDDNTENEIPSTDIEGVKQEVQDVQDEQQPPPPEEGAPSLASKIAGDMGRLVEEAKQGDLVDAKQRAQLDKWMGVLNDSVKNKDGEGLVRSLQGLTKAVNMQVNANLRQTRLAAVLNGRATNGVPMADFVQARLDAGNDIFGAPNQVSRPDRPEGEPDETPEGVDPEADKVDNAVSEALLMDDGSTLVMQGDEPVDEGFYVIDPATISEYGAMPTTADITDFLNETQGSDYDGVSVWFDEADGKYRMARVGIFQTEQDASDAAANSGTNQYVNIADGALMNIATGGDPDLPTEAVEDPRSEERAVRRAGAGKASARSTSKQKKMLDHVAETSGDEELGRITAAIKNGEEISGADASRLADAVDAMDAAQFDKPSDKGVASQMAHKLARAAGEEGARGYSSQNTALRRTSDVGISLSAQSRDDTIRGLVDDARTDVKNGDNAAAAGKFREAADLYDEQGHSRTEPSTRAREHADRLDAMGGVTAPAPEGAPEVAPEQAPEVPPAPEAPEGAGSEPLDVTGSPTEILEHLFDRIGQPEEYGTEHQGRMLGEARSLATEDLTDDAAARLETAAAAAPDGSDEKRLMLEAADALRGGESAGPEPPEAESVDSALGTADSALENERLSEGENGPRGWDDQMDEVNNLITSIRDRADDSTLAADLRELADMMENTFVDTDPTDAVAEIRAAADALDTGAPAPEGGTPGEAGGDTPFRLDNPQGTRDVLVTPEFADKRSQAVADYHDALNREADRLSQNVDEGTIVEQMLNDRILDAQQKYHDETRAWIGMKYGGIENLTPERVAEVLERYPNAQEILDTWSDLDYQLDPELTQDLNQVLGEQVVSAAADAKAAVDALDYGDGSTADARTATGRTLDMLSNYERHMSQNSQIQSMSDFRDMLPEVASTADYIERFRDPEVRRAASASERQELVTYAKTLARDINSSKMLFDRLRDSGVDPAPLENVLREQLDKHDLGSLLSMDDYPPPELRSATDKAMLDFRHAQDAGEPGVQESVALLGKIAESMRVSSSANAHQTYANVVDQVVNYSLAHNNSVVPAAISQAVRDIDGDRYGFINDTLMVMDLMDAVRDGDAEGVTAVSGGRFRLLEWDTSATTMNPMLVTDDRKGKGTFESDFLFKEGMAEITPNVAAALNSMFAAHGGGIYRTDTNIAEASNPAAANWRQGWNRNSGADTRQPTDVTGVWSRLDNALVLADKTFLEPSLGTNTVSHELGHALDSMLSESTGIIGYFSEQDTEFLKLRSKLLEISSFGKSAEDSLMYWYFRNADEGSTAHNGSSGTPETWAEGYAAYAMMRRRMPEIEPGYGEDQWRKKMYREGSAPLMHGNSFQALEKGLKPVQISERREAAGQAIFEFFDRFENERLPELMKDPKLVKARPDRPSPLAEVAGAPPAPQQKIATASQKANANTHNSKKHGLIQMQQVERGSPEWDQMEAAIKAGGPGTSMPPPTALYTTWNPDFASQGATVIWKTVMPGQPKYVVEYTNEHKATQLAAKFQRQQRVNTALDAAHAKAEAEAGFDETAALVLAMIETGMRVGSSEKAGSVDRATGKRKSTFGGATMQAKHVFFPSDSLMRFKFPGKAGKENVYESRNPALRAAVKQLLAGKKPSDQVFAATNSGRTIDYLRETTGIEDIINHDTRTRYATNMARELVAKWPKSRLPKDEKSYRKAQSDVAKKVGAAINDSWPVARDSYISPAVWERFEQSSGMPYSFDDSPPYGLVEGETVTTLIPGAPGGPAPSPEGAPGAPAAASDMSPSAYRAMQGMDPEPTSDAPLPAEPLAEDEAWSLPTDPAGVAERETWYASYQWPDPPIVAGPDPDFPDDIEEEPTTEEAG